jgi:cell division protein FtsZ
MQPMSHNGYRREISPEQWIEKTHGKAEIRSEVCEEDQWAVLRQEVEGERTQRQGEHVQSAWDQRDTGDDTVAAPSSFEALRKAQHRVDIVVAGVGGGGMNAVNRMMSTRVRGVRFVAMNTDAQVLSLSTAPSRLCLGQHYTKGLGAGGNASVGTRAATESADEIRAALGAADLVFIAAGMGGGTGTGAAPVVASIARKSGALTVGIVTLPFSFEGTRRRRIALEGIAELSKEIDALITVPNDRLLSTVGRDLILNEAFQIADDVLRQGVQGIAEVINVPGMVNVDFADVRSVLREAGTALMSIGRGQGRKRAQQAAEEAVAGGFLNVTIRGARRVLFNISGGEDMTLFEVNEVAERIGQAIDDSADITFGAVVDPALQDAIRVTLIAAGMEEMHTSQLPVVRPEAQQVLRQASHSQTGSGTRAVPGNIPASNAPALPETPQTPTALPSRPAVQNTPPAGIPAQKPAPSQQTQRPHLPPGRQQRSLNDLRGIRSMGRRYDPPKEPNHADEEAIDMPPFLKRYE